MDAFLIVMIPFSIVFVTGIGLTIYLMLSSRRRYRDWYSDEEARTGEVGFVHHHNHGGDGNEAFHHMHMAHHAAHQHAMDVTANNIAAMDANNPAMYGAGGMGMGGTVMGTPAY